MKGVCRTLCAVVAVVGIASSGATADRLSRGLAKAAKNYGLNELIKKTKRAAPDSPLPTVIQWLLAGVSMATDPTATLEGVYPGSLAAGAISQLLEKHGADIARMSYRDSDFGDLYGDPSLIPGRNRGQTPDPIWALCAEMFEFDGGRVTACSRLTRLIQGCNDTRIDEEAEVQHCNEFLSEFYENMAWEGKNDLVKQAGRVAVAEFARATESPASRAQTDGGAKSFAGNGWTSLGRLNRFCSKELLCGGEIPECNSANMGKVIQDRRSHNKCVAQGCEGGTQTITDRHGTYHANFETYVCEHP